MRSPRALAVLLALAASAPSPAAAAPHPLRHDPALDLSLTLGAVLLTGGLELAKPALAPERCRVCGTNALDEAVRDALVSPRPARAARASDVLAAAVLPAGVAAHQLLAARAAGAWREGGRDLLFVAEAVMVSAALNQVVKLSVGRQRPFVHHADGPRERDPDDDLSFYSGHTALAFALVASAGTVSSLRGYPSAPWFWGVGLPLAAGVGWLRIAADKHYLTDVLAGAVAGSAVGVALPLLLHRREDEAPGGRPGAAALRVTPLPLGIVLVF